MKLVILIIYFVYIVYAWDYISFSQTWAPEWISRNDITMDNKCDSNSNYGSITTSNYNYFIIHGIWPDYNNGSFPQFCNLNTLPKFNITSLQPILWYLNRYWNNFRNSTELWEHEYYKHYSCARTDHYLGTELDYFKMGIIFYRKWNILEILKSNGIFPDNTLYYATKTIVNVIQKKLNSTIIITCPDDTLNEVRICINKDMNIINCPNNNGNCDQKYIRLISNN